MTSKLLVIDDHPDFAVAIAQLLRGAASVAVRGVDPTKPCLEALQVVRAEGVSQLFFLIDLHLPDHTGRLSTEGGAIFARHLLDMYPDEAGFSDRIVLYSNHPEVNGTKLAADLGVRFVRKLDVGDFLLVTIPALLAKARHPVPEHQNQGRLRQHDRDARWFYKHSEAYRANAGQIAVVHQRRVWGIGVDLENALAQAKMNSECPAAEDLLFIAIPDHAYFDERGRRVEVLTLNERADGNEGHRPATKTDDPGN